MEVNVDVFFNAGKRSLNDALIHAVQEVLKTSTPERFGPGPVLRFWGMSLERVDNVRSQETGLPIGTIVVNQLEYIVEVQMKFEPNLQLRTRTTPGNQGSFCTQGSTLNARNYSG